MILPLEHRPKKCAKEAALADKPVQLDLNSDEGNRASAGACLIVSRINLSGLRHQGEE